MGTELAAGGAKMPAGTAAAAADFGPGPSSGSSAGRSRVRPSERLTEFRFCTHHGHMAACAFLSLSKYSRQQAPQQ